MAPLVLRSRTPRGEPPTLDHCGCHRRNVSFAAALRLSPRRDWPGLYAMTLVDAHLDNWYVAAFLEAMLHESAETFLVVWDCGTMPKGDRIRHPASHLADRLTMEYLPPWAPGLNPVDPLWG